MKNSTLFSRTLIALFLSLTSIAASANETSNPWISNACSAPEYDSSMLRGVLARQGVKLPAPNVALEENCK